jgi:hypothetical protein
LTARASTVIATTIDDAAAFFIPHLVSSVNYHAVSDFTAKQKKHLATTLLAINRGLE